METGAVCPVDVTTMLCPKIPHNRIDKHVILVVWKEECPQISMAGKSYWENFSKDTQHLAFTLIFCYMVFFFFYLWTIFWYLY